MRWMRYRIATTAEAEDILISELYDAGYEGAQIEDHKQLTPLEKEQMFVDILPEMGEDDGSAFVSVYVELEEGADAETLEKYHREKISEVIDGLRLYGMDYGSGEITVSVTEDIDWINNWKKYFHQFRIDDLLVIPSWEEPETVTTTGRILHIDPGTAFGTGMHETTQLCIRQIWTHLKDGMKILDVGTGSGILGIVAIMYGAGSVEATDLDPCAEAAVADNLEVNGIDAGRFHLHLGNVITDKGLRDELGYGKYDIVVANILADVLIPLSPVVPEMLTEGGVFITSGIIEGKENAVARAMKEVGLTVISQSAQGEWRCVVGRKEG